MTSVYRISLKPVEAFGNVEIRDEQMKLTPDQLQGIAVMADAMLGDLRDEVFEIRDRALRKINLDRLIQQSGAEGTTVVMEGEAVFELTPQKDVPWLELIQDEASKYGQVANITKSYTVKIDASRYLLLQFNNPGFYQGLKLLVDFLGQDPSGYIKFLHRRNTPLDDISL